MKSRIYAFFTGFVIFILAAVAMRTLASGFGDSATNPMAVGFAVLVGLTLGIAYFSHKYSQAAGGQRTQGLIHLAAAICVLLMITVLPAMHRAYGFMHSLGPTSPGALFAVRLVLTVLVLVIPTFLLGGALVFASLVDPAARRGSTGGTISAALLGLAVAVPFVAFWVLPRWGTSVALAVSAIILAAMSAAGLLARRGSGTMPGAGSEPSSGGSGSLLAGPGLFLISFSVISHTALCMRVLRQITGINAHTFLAGGTVVALGLFIGCAIVGRFIYSAKNGHHYTGLFAMAATFYTLTVIGLVDSFPVRFLGYIDNGNAATGGFILAYLYLAATTLLVPAVLLGAALAGAGAARGPRAGLRRVLLPAGAGAAMAYALALPAIATGLGLETGLVFAAWLGLAGGIMLSAASGVDRKMKIAAVLPALVITIILTAAHSPWNRSALASGVFENPHTYANVGNISEALAANDIVYYEEDREGIVTVARTGDGTFLRLNGMTVGSASERIAPEIMAAHIPMLIHKDPKKVLLLGLGTGVTMGSVQRYEISSMTVAEPVGAIAEAARLFSWYSNNALEDRRSSVVRMGPREFMRLTDEKYDVIIHQVSAFSDPVHASALTLDFILLARSVLEYDGVFCYMVDVTGVSRDCLMTTVTAYMTAFPYVTTWYAGSGRVILAGSMQPFDLSETQVEGKLERPWVSNDLKRLHIESAAGVFANLMMNREGLRAYLGAFSGRNTDSRPCLECDAVPVQSPAEVIATLIDINKFSMNPAQLLGDFEKDSMDYKIARDKYDRCREARNYYIGSYSALAAGDGKEAARRLEYGVSLCSANGLIQERLSYLYLYVSRDLDAAGRFEEAINVARRAIEVSPYSYLAFYNLATLERKRDPDTALGLLERVKQLNPDFLTAEILKAQLFLETGRVTEASDVISEVLSKEPMNTRAHHIRALCFVERGLTEAARVELEFVLDADPENVEALAALGYTWLLVGDIDEAEKYYARAISLEPDNLGVLNNYATILAEKGEYREAIVIWQKALKLDPANAGIKANIQEAKEKMAAD